MGRVLFVSSIRRFGGGERWMCDAASGLRERGHETAILSRPGSVLDERRRRFGLAGGCVEMRGDLDPWAIAKIAGWIGRFRPDVVCPNLDREIRISALAIALATLGGAALRRKIPPPRLIPRRGSEFPLKGKLHYRVLYGKFVHRVIVNSRATRETMLSTVPWFDREKAVVLYNGIDLRLFDTLEPRREELRGKLRQELGVAERAPVVVIVGEITERKGHRFIVEAAPMVLGHHPETSFLFVGDGDARAEVERLVRQSGHGDRFRLVGFREDVPEILTGSDVLVLPSTVEGFGYVLVEAMAARIPVVASRTSSIPEIVRDCESGYLHDVGDSRAIANHLSNLLADEALRKRMGSVGRREAEERFCITAMLDRLEEIFFEDPIGESAVSPVVRTT